MCGALGVRKEEVRNTWEGGPLAGSHEALKARVRICYFILRDRMPPAGSKQRSDVNKITLDAVKGNGWHKTGGGKVNYSGSEGRQTMTWARMRGRDGEK